MLDSYYRLEIPADLKAYYYVTDVISQVDAGEKCSLKSNVVINRDAQGCISSVKYYTQEGELLKEVFYQADVISKIDYYRERVLYSTEAFKDGRTALKFIFQKNGYLAHTYEYDYNKKGQVLSICKKSNGREIVVVYKYDELDRIITRKLYLNSERVIEQHYSYDILDRIKEYSDDNQKITVNRMSKKNELLSYVITDKIGNKIEIQNNFALYGYANTSIIVNGHCTTVKDKNYVDNIMLKKPYTSEDDLDLIIANLFDNSKSPNGIVSGELDKNIETRVLPISMRKRLLYNKVSKVI